MGVLTTQQLSDLLDKLARYATEGVGDPEFDAGFTAGLEKAAADVLSGANSIANFLIDIGDEDVLADLIPAARDLDEVHPTEPDGFLLNLPGITKMVSALNTHFKRNGFTGLDGKLTALNASTPTLRAHYHFRKYLKTLAPGNSFIANDLDLATFAVTGGATGTYARLTSIDKTKTAGAKLVIKNVGALSSAPVVTVVAKKLDGTSANLTATLSVATDGHETDLSDATMIFVDTTGISIASGGTNLDAFKVVAKTDRDISAA